MSRQGVKLQPGLGRQAYKVGGKFKFWGGVELLKALYAAAEKHGIAIAYETPVLDLIQKNGVIAGVLARSAGKPIEIESGAVILACGGFESNPELRARYLGPGWDAAKVRGMRFNMGDGLMMALRVGAQPHGNWSGCHSVAGTSTRQPSGI